MGRLLVLVLALAGCPGQPPSLIQDSPVPICGDGNTTAPEVCDDGNTDDGDLCNSTCTEGTSPSLCGNNQSDTGELCDDGNQIGGDGCSADCTSDERCGNGVVDATKGETCDDGNLSGGDGCSALCQSNEGCGNGTVDSGEDCDAGANGSANCDVNCTVATCGDGTVNTFRGEQCDAGPNGDAACDTDCTPAFCGDSTINTLRGESCDDGNNINTDACVQNCKAATCGDGFVRNGVEACDDGNMAAGDGCTGTCTVENQPMVYVLSNLNQLVGMGTACTPSTTRPYDNCAGGQTGFTWTDTSPFQPSMVRIEVSNGVHCGPNAQGQLVPNVMLNAVTTLNGVSSGSFVLNPNANGCTCGNTEVLNTWTLTNVSGYQRGAVNTLRIGGMVNGQGQAACFGVDFSNALGGYVRVTVFP